MGDSKKHRQEANEAFHVLCALFPTVFYPPLRKMKYVLAIGIDEEIYAYFPSLDKKIVDIILRSYTSTPRYRKALLSGTIRVHLDGSDAGKVDPIHKKMARDYLRDRFHQPLALAS